MSKSLKEIKIGDKVIVIADKKLFLADDDYIKKGNIGTVIDVYIDEELTHIKTSINAFWWNLSNFRLLIADENIKCRKE